MAFPIIATSTTPAASSTGKTRSAATSAVGTSATSGATIGQAAGMGKQDFLTLLIAQLKNQDPMKPMEDREFVTQLAQFSSLETLEALKGSMEELAGAQLLGQAAGLIGKQVEAKLPDGTVVTGVVSQVKMLDGKPQLVIGTRTIDLSYVTNVGGDATAPAGSMPTTATTPATATTAARPTAPSGSTVPASTQTTQPPATTSATAALAARAAAAATAAAIRTTGP